MLKIFWPTWGTSLLIFLAKYYYRDEVEEDENDRACRMHEAEEKCTQGSDGSESSGSGPVAGSCEHSNDLQVL